MPTDSSQNLCRALVEEWSRVGRSEAAVLALRRWSDDEPQLRQFATPADVVAHCQARGDTRASNELVGSLLRVASDPFAARTLLQALLPSVASRAYKAARLAGDGSTGSVSDWNQEMVMRVLERISDLAGTSPAWPAVTIIESAWWRVERTLRSERRARTSAVPLDELPDVAAPADRTAAEELASVLVQAVRDHRIAARAASVIYTTRIRGHSFEQVAAWDGRGVEAVRKVRYRAEAALAASKCG